MSDLFKVPDGTQLSLFEPHAVTLGEGYSLLCDLRFSEARERFEYVLSRDPDNDSALRGRKAAKFWQPRFDRVNRCPSSKGRADMISNLWQEYEAQAREDRFAQTEAFRRLRESIFSRILALAEGSGEEMEFVGPDVPLGYYYLEVGQFEKAIDCLERVIRKGIESSRLYGYLGDAYYGLGKIRNARICYRVALETDPQGIDFSGLKDPEIVALLDKVKDTGVDDLGARERSLATKSHKRTQKGLVADDLVAREWLLVYGWFEGIFTWPNCKDIEVGKKLEEEIEELWNRVDGKHSRRQREIITAKLWCRCLKLSQYFLSGYVSSRYSEEEVRLKMKELQPQLFQRYLQHIERLI
ncbi:MAG: tetratricopeptide repeat protein [bacterium]